MFKGLFLDDEDQPSFNQPVPLYLVPLIINVSEKEFSELLTDGYKVQGKTIFPFKVFSYDNTKKPKEVHSSSVYANNNFKSNHFIWSDDITYGFSQLIDDISNREDAANSGTKLIWDPDSTSIISQLNSCPDFNLILPAGAQNKSKKQKMYLQWCDMRQKLIDSKKDCFFKGDRKQHINEAAIARKIQKDLPKNYSEHHIRSTLRKYCK